MATDAVVVKRSAGRRLAGLFHGRPRLQIGSLLAAPMAWLVILYLGSLVVLLITAFWTVDPLSGTVIKEFSLENFEELVNVPVYRGDRLADGPHGDPGHPHRRDHRLPDRLLHGQGGGPQRKALLVVAVLMPLWASYLVKIIAWRAILAEHGVLNWALSPIGLHGPGYGRHRGLAGDELPLAAVHDPADLRRAGADPATR